MIRGFYSAASGLEAGSLTQDVIAQNLAFLTMPGYRSRGVAFQTFEEALAGFHPELAEGELLGVAPAALFNNFALGPINTTNNPLDVSLGAANTFFVVNGPNGPLYTRNGSFMLNGAGVLQTKSGLNVQGQGGVIAIPPGTININITQEGAVQVDDGTGAVPATVGIMQVVQIPNPQVLQEVGPTLFQGPAAGPPPGAAAIRITQGTLEQANVEPVSEMVRMIYTSRFFDSCERALRALSDAIQQNTRPER